MPVFPTTHSIPSPEAVKDRVLPGYSIGRPERCTLHMSGVNDIYAVQTDSGRPYILKVYRFGWRSEAEVLYELDLLEHLHSKGVSVALPVPREDGARTYPVPAPEGVRQAVLFEYAAGKAPSWPFYENEAEARLLGGMLATIHNGAAGFRSRHRRARLDEAFFLDETLSAARPYLAAHRAEDWQYLSGLTERLRARLRALDTAGLSRGVCHGDYHPGNVFIADDQVVTAYDFDVCGPGWTAYDLGVWREGAGTNGNVWASFLNGYREKRAVSAADLEAVPLFRVLRMLDLVRLKTTFTTRGQWDSWDIDFFFNDTFASLREREGEALGPAAPVERE
uniref:Aminoglycoside phosphotransferase domain-containing protein n=1 Tax=uncultured Armatimonadetes bacterium TaxID=157466 RepID=A0A6J4ISJ7_9BACT|nr:hypothetical protein AVDCRST_MAG63-2287 [uncultured Armatimonadetes bacterium]